MMLQELICHILASIVEHKEALHVSEEHVDGKLIFKISVDAHDLGRVIGRDGQTIRAIRSLIAAINPSDEQVSVDICE